MKTNAEKQKFKEFLKKVEDPNYQREINRALPPNANSLQVAKYKLCKQMLVYQQENKLSDEEIAKKITNLIGDSDGYYYIYLNVFNSIKNNELYTFQYHCSQSQNLAKKSHKN